MKPSWGHGPYPDGFLWRMARQAREEAAEKSDATLLRIAERFEREAEELERAEAEDEASVGSHYAFSNAP